MKLKIFVTIISSLAGIGLVFCGIIMAFNGIQSTGVINIKSVFVSGKIESGSLGLLFTFLGVVLLIVPVIRKYETKTIYRKKIKKQEIDWSLWESGDPYVELIMEIFPEESVPNDVSNIPVCDWLSKDKIEEMVNLYLKDELMARAISFINYHYADRRREARYIGNLVSVILKSVFDGSVSSELTSKANNLKSNNVVAAMVHMLKETVAYYFIVKKRIFAGWDKYPAVHPPIHKELADWLEVIESKWENIIKELMILVLPPSE